jgi:hypothetical protein
MSWLLAPFRWLGALVAWIHAAFCALLDPEGRRAWAVVLCGGCGIVMTGLAYWGMFILRDHAGYVFWLATEAMGIVLIVISAITGLLVKRNIGGQVDLPGGGGGKLNIDQEDGDASPPSA